MKLMSFSRGVISDGIKASHTEIKAQPDHGICECIRFSEHNSPEVDEGGLVHTASFHLEHEEFPYPVLVAQSEEKFQPSVLMRISTQSESPRIRGSIYCVGDTGVWNRMLANRASRRRFQADWQEGFYVFEPGRKVTVILQNGEEWSLFCDHNEDMRALQLPEIEASYIDFDEFQIEVA